MSETSASKNLPFIVQPGDYENLVAYLLDQPARFSIPVLNYMQAQQAQAQQAARAQTAAVVPEATPEATTE